MYDRQYICFDDRDPEKPQLYSDPDKLLKHIREDVECTSYKHRARFFTKILEIEIEQFSSVAGSWKDVTEDLYNWAEEKEGVL